MENIIFEIKSRNSCVVCITNNDKIIKHVNHVFYFETKSTLFCLLFIVPLQIMAYLLALENNINPDYPRNLAKVVTVE